MKLRKLVRYKWSDMLIYCLICFQFIIDASVLTYVTGGQLIDDNTRERERERVIQSRIEREIIGSENFVFNNLS